MQQAEANVEKWKQLNGWKKQPVKKQDAQTQTEWKDAHRTEEKQQQAWFNQFADSAKKKKGTKKIPS